MNKKIITVIIGLTVLVGGYFLFHTEVASDGQVENVVAVIVTDGFHGLITATEFSQKITTGEYVVLDIRTQAEYDQQRITQDALLVDFYAPDFKQQLSVLDKDKKYLMHCRSGSRSAAATRVMKELGFAEFYELGGGINTWNQAGYETFSE